MRNQSSTMRLRGIGMASLIAICGGAVWSLKWQETAQQTLEAIIPRIVQALVASRDKLQQMMDAADVEAERRSKEWQEQRERYARQEDARRIAQALSESRQQLAEIIEAWGKAVTIDRFFSDATERLKSREDGSEQRLGERLLLARTMMGSVDPLEFIEKWKSPEERYETKFP